MKLDEIDIDDGATFSGSSTHLISKFGNCTNIAR